MAQSQSLSDERCLGVGDCPPAPPHPPPTPQPLNPLLCANSAIAKDKPSGYTIWEIMIIFQAFPANHMWEFKSFYTTDVTDCGKNWGNAHAGELKKKKKE